MTQTTENQNQLPPAPEGVTSQQPPADTDGPGAGPINAAPIMDAEDVADAVPLALVTVLIERDSSTRIPTKVFGYEVPVLLEIYGEDNVFVVDEEEVDTDDFDVGRAYDGMRTKYRAWGNEFRAVYSSLRDFAKVVGVKAPTGTASSRDQKSLLTDRSKDKATKATARKAAAKKAAAKR